MPSTSSASASASGSTSAPAPKPRVQQLKPSSRVAGAPPPRPLPRDGPSIQANTSATGRSDQSGAGGAGTGDQPAQRTGPRIVTGQGSGNTIIVNPCQKGNPLLQHVRQVGWEYGEITADYLVGVSSGVLFLSLRYHRLHPEYIHSRIAKIRGSFSLRVLLVLCDVDTHETAIKELTKVALINSMTLMIAWTAEEAGKYVEAYKLFEHRPPDVLRERVADDYLSHIQSALTNIRGVNKTDVITLATNFGSFKKLSTASAGQLSLCPGFGDLKARRLREAFALPFRVGETRLGRDRLRKEPKASEDTSARVGRAKVLEASALSDSGNAARSGDRLSTAGGADKASDAPNISFNNELDELTEEEQLRLALEMSVGNELDEEDEDF
ncbi:hypothetical protein IE81DRAFT_285593 [Ceraceosorus guamensis]|uniref:DNA excision repair protein ERCC-1 n=1 Tax=Ceraceosorus guamensis TaxID=1522189 RepID=A0A316W682_9BASI|nr:hypothetical protein IE81DRAFT_285593 [Ceraceosorus guamensis]PWN45397.1 hypothetical protein IE81DRAFT_285593 [Ceraceosorus guamensis]